MTDLLSLVAAMAAVCALGYVGLKLLRRVTPRPEHQIMAFRAALPVGPRERVVVVRWRDRELVLGVSSGAITLLADAAAAAETGAIGEIEPTATREALDALVARLRRLTRSRA